MSPLTCLAGVVVPHLFMLWLLRGRGPGEIRALALLGMLAGMVGLYLVTSTLDSPLPLEGSLGTLVVFAPLLALLTPFWLAAWAKQP